MLLFIIGCSTDEENTSSMVNDKTEESEKNPTQYTLTVSAAEGGSVSALSNGEGVPGGTYDKGTEITIIASASEGYEFVRWEGSVNNFVFKQNTPELSIKINSDINLNAIFYKSLSISAKQIDFDYQLAYCLDGKISSTVWLGNKLGIVIEGETPSDRDPKIMKQIIIALERIIDQFYSITQIGQLNMLSSYENKMVIEVVNDNCGAGGLAHHEVLGISIGASFLNEVYNSFLSGNREIHQIFYYEINRNFWKRKWIKKFDWAMDGGDRDWGHWTTGFNVAQAIIMPKQLNTGFIYFGWTIEQFRYKMIKNLEIYMDNEEYDFYNGWMQNRMPWDRANSVNDLMTGLIIYSYENFGGDNWLKNFYKYIDSDLVPDRENIYSYQQCRDNIYKIWSLSAEKDLISFFTNDLKWIISDDAISFISNFNMD